MTERQETDPFALVEEGEDGVDFEYEEGLKWEEGAMSRLRDIVEKREGMWMLRVVVEGGGCSGYHVSFVLDDKRGEDDVVFGEGGVCMVIDREGLRLVDGACVRYHESLGGSYFSLDIPSAVSGCGCGESFSL